MNQDSQLWYVKVKGRVKGPFASGLISKHILLGRIHPNDLLSQDKELWRKASSINEVMPDIIKNRHDPNYKERLRAARRWADERGEVREVGDQGEEKVFTPRKKVTHLKIKTTGVVGLLTLFIAIVAVVYAMFVFTPEDPLAQVDCASPGSDGQLFDGCHLQRKNFSNRSLKESSFKNTLLQNSQFKYSQLQNSVLDYANLSHANLTGANFSNASLRAVDLRGAVLQSINFADADLSYADLTGAKVAKINFKGTKLANTIWFDGKVCHKESVSRCLSR